MLRRRLNYQWLMGSISGLSEMAVAGQSDTLFASLEKLIQVEIQDNMPRCSKMIELSDNPIICFLFSLLYLISKKLFGGIENINSR